MIIPILTFVLIAAVSATNLFLPIDVRFDIFKKKYNKTYENPEKEVRAFRIFKKNDAYITKMNAKGLSFTLGHNEFSDICHGEFKNSFVGGYKPNQFRKNVSKSTFELEVGNAPSSIDWVEKGAVTGVKNQGQCGSCWTFATTGSIEGANFIQNNELISLSEQNIVNCDHTTGADGCSGGTYDNAFAYIKKHGICKENDDPYIGKDMTCKNQCRPAITLNSWVDVPRMDEEALKAAVAKGPVAVAIQANQVSFQHYKKGIFTGECGTQLDHAVLAVGYGTLDGVDYWKVKNSWGTSWGDDGYILIERGTNKCGIAMDPSFPTGVVKDMRPFHPCASDTPIPGSNKWLLPCFAHSHTYWKRESNNFCKCASGYQYDSTKEKCIECVSTMTKSKQDEPADEIFHHISQTFRAVYRNISNNFHTIGNYLYSHFPKMKKSNEEIVDILPTIVTE